MSQNHFNRELHPNVNKFREFNTGAAGDKYNKHTSTLEAIDKAIFESYMRLISDQTTYTNDVAPDENNEPINLTNDARNDSYLHGADISDIGHSTSFESAISDHDETSNDTDVKIDIDTLESSEGKGQIAQNGVIKSISDQHLNAGTGEKDDASYNEMQTGEDIDLHLLASYETDNNTMDDAKDTELSENEMSVNLNSSDAKTEMTEAGLTCKLCGETFRNLYHLSKHKRIHLGIERPYACQLCEKTFADSGGLRKHLRTHTGAKPYKCNVCSKHFTQAHNLKRHILIHTGEQPIQCLICLQQFTCASNAKRHIKLKHSNDLDLSEEADVDAVLETLIKRTPAKSNKLKDNSLASKVDVPDEVSEERFMGTRKRLGRKGRICMICDREFSRTSHLRDHMFTHTGERPYICHLCGHATTVKSALDKHLRVHSGERPHACDICEKRFTCASDMHTHQQQVHSTEKAFQCGLCNTQFAKSYMLTRHMLGCQREERAFRCDICDKCFKTESYLSVHKRKHSSVSWSCEICSKQYITRADLTKHFQTQHLLSKEKIQKVYDAESTLIHQLGENNSNHNHNGGQTSIPQFGDENPELADNCDSAFIPEASGENLEQESIRHSTLTSEPQQANSDDSMLNQE